MRFIAKKHRKAVELTLEDECRYDMHYTIITVDVAGIYTTIRTGFGDNFSQ